MKVNHVLSEAFVGSVTSLGHPSVGVGELERLLGLLSFLVGHPSSNSDPSSHRVRRRLERGVRVFGSTEVDLIWVFVDGYFIFKFFGYRVSRRVARTLRI